MKIELRKILINLAFSRETIMFKADLYIDDVKAGDAHNDGCGGRTNYYRLAGCQELINKAEQYCKTLPPVDYGEVSIPMNLEHFIDKLVDEELKRKDQLKIEKKYPTRIIFGVKGGTVYTEVGWGKTPLAQIPKDKLQKCIDKYKAEFKNGETFWNTNFEQLGINV